MHILVTGSNGYIAQSIITHFIGEKNFTIDFIHRNIVNLEDKTALSNWFRGKYFDAVIHTATVGGSRLQTEDELVFTRNVSMYDNLMRHKNRFGKFISFGSGAELNPTTPYGRSKRYIADRMKDFSFCHNIRIFGVFDHNELPSRFIKSNILRCLKEEPMIVHQDKMMDFFYMDDLCMLVRHFINSTCSMAEVNCSYSSHKNLMQIAKQINVECGRNVDIICNTSEVGCPYIGNSNLPNLAYIGFDRGLSLTTKHLKQSLSLDTIR